MSENLRTGYRERMDIDHEAHKHDVPPSTVKGEAERAAAEDTSDQKQDVLDDAKQVVERGSGADADAESASDPGTNPDPDPDSDVDPDSDADDGAEHRG